jgi:hypothetical protein
VWRRRAVTGLRGRLAIPIRIRRRMLLAVRLAGVTAAVGRLLVVMMLHLSFEWSVNETIDSNERSRERFLLIRLRRAVIRRIGVLLLLLLLWWGIARRARIRRIVGHSGWRRCCAALANREVHGHEGD